MLKNYRFIRKLLERINPIPAPNYVVLAPDNKIYNKLNKNIKATVIADILESDSIDLIKKQIPKQVV